MTFKRDDNREAGLGGFTVDGKSASLSVQDPDGDNVGVLEVTALPGSEVAVNSSRATRSGKVTTHSGVAASSVSAEIDMSDYKYVAYQMRCTAGTPNATLKLQSAFETGGNFIQTHDSGAKSASFMSGLVENPGGFLKIDFAWVSGTWTIELIGVN